MVIPCLGSIFLVGAMFYGAYRIAGQPKLHAASWGLMAAYTAANLGCSLLGNFWINLMYILNTENNGIKTDKSAWRPVTCLPVLLPATIHRLERERNLYRRQSEMQYRYYAREEEKYEESRKLVHAYCS